VDTFLDRAGKIVGIFAGLAAIIGGLSALVAALQHPRLQLQIDKDRIRIPPVVLSNATGTIPHVVDYTQTHFGLVTLGEGRKGVRYPFLCSSEAGGLLHG